MDKKGTCKSKYHLNVTVRRWYENLNVKKKNNKK